MRIAIDVRKIGDFGIGTYLRNLIRLLPQLDTENRYHLLGYRSDEALLRSLNDDAELSWVSARNYSLAEHREIPIKLLRIRADLYHAPHYVLPYWTPCRSVVTVHDVIHLLFPQYLPSRFGAFYARRMIRRALDQSREVMTVSSQSKADLLERFDVSPEKIHVIANGIDPAMLRAPEDGAIDAVKRRFRIEGRNALFVGNIKPHKNVERLIAAFGKLATDDRFSNLNLIIVGDEISRYPSLRRAVEEYGIRDRVRFFGFVPEQTLVALYRAADVFVFPSLYEGFGLPPLEAMANGTPVITSNVSSLPEVVGDAAITVDPESVEAISDAMRRVLLDEALQATLTKAGLARANSFSWEVAVDKIRGVYRDALAS